MKPVLGRAFATAVLALGGAGCGNDTPDWIREPVAEGGFAATQCVKDSGNLATDRQVVVAGARADIARQYEERVAEMENAYGALDHPAEPSPAASTFTGVSKQVAAETIEKLTPARVEYVEFDAERQLCALLAMDRAQARQVYEKVVAASGRKLSEAADAELFRAFSGDDD